jgi:YidC/Oxa1 family membrane protein insertase
MKQEQRLLLAFVLIAGILAVWSTLTPPHLLPANQPPKVETEKKEAVLVAKAGDKTEDFQLGRFTLGVGETRGGISTLEVDRETLLKQDAPGLLEVRSGQLNPEPVRFQNRLENGKIISSGNAGDLQLTRTLELSGEDPHQLRCSLQIRNPSQESKRAYFQVLLYRPLRVLQISGGPTPAGGTLHLDGKTVPISVGSGQRKRFSGTPDWVASQGKYHVVIFQLPGKEGVFHVEHPAGGETAGFLELPAQEIPAGGEANSEILLYVGPMSLEPLRKAGLEEALSFGAFSGVSRWLLGILGWSYNLLHNYGLAICLLSFAIWLPFSPITWYSQWISTQTMKKMAALKPQETRIRQEHKSNPDQIHRELMQLYKKHGVNPASGCIGCLPLLFTMPIYIALFQVLTRAPELRGAGFLWIKDLSAPDGMIPLPFIIPLIGSHLNVLPIVATVATYFQQAGMQPSPGEVTPEQKAQQDMMKIFPLVFMVLFYGLPSGFMLYWVINSVLTVAQQVAADRIAKARS